MKALLDTHVFLWWVMDDERLTIFVRDFISNEKNELFLSAASCWEMMIKAKLGRIKFPDSAEKFIPAQMRQNNINGLPVHISHALHMYSLPDKHKDPFDRILIAQAQAERIPIVTNDSLIADYDIRVIWDKKARQK
ncbi:MAG: type II toxin-antitoxin system VapC family toxin [Nitrospirae bacterium]|nr:type II toxin-antitoxin system VapC family toxin [Nitrospirota bacterium]